jgi:hypothetical protein
VAHLPRVCPRVISNDLPSVTKQTQAVRGAQLWLTKPRTPNIESPIASQTSWVVSDMASSRFGVHHDRAIRDRPLGPEGFSRPSAWVM